ncbi:MAG: hypothetical protein Q4B70_17700 [Lachnospiraceae bacterium]|nr:hypothetical protein [Lachnospiraceae bacterium]
MEKVIKLIMNTDKSIKILVNEEEKHIIAAQNRSIAADKIYEVIGFSLGDHYSITSENESSVDNQVLEFFSDVLTDIITKINSISVD